MVVLCFVYQTQFWHTVAHASDNVEVRGLRELHQKPYKCKQTLHLVKIKNYITATSVMQFCNDAVHMQLRSCSDGS